MTIAGLQREARLAVEGDVDFVARSVHARGSTRTSDRPGPPRDGWSACAARSASAGARRRPGARSVRRPRGCRRSIRSGVATIRPSARTRVTGWSADRRPTRSMIRDSAPLVITTSLSDDVLANGAPSPARAAPRASARARCVRASRRARPRATSKSSWQRDLGQEAEAAEVDAEDRHVAAGAAMRPAIPMQRAVTAEHQHEIARRGQVVAARRRPRSAGRRRASPSRSRRPRRRRAPRASGELRRARRRRASRPAWRSGRLADR